MITAEEALQLSEFRIREDVLKNYLAGCDREVREAAAAGKRKAVYQFSTVEEDKDKIALEVRQVVATLEERYHYKAEYGISQSDGFAITQIRIFW